MKTKKHEEKYFRKIIDSPTGKLTLIASNTALKALLFSNTYHGFNKKNPINEENDIISKTEKELLEYFKGERKFFDIPLDPDGTDFQKQTWNELSKIPYAEKVSYQELAKRVGDIKKARAVGNANGKNPIPIIIPCHRVIAKDGSLGGYGGGLKIKEFLLNLEKHNN